MDGLKSNSSSVSILGHIDTGMGEKSLTFKMQRALEKGGYQVDSVLDLINFMGEDYEPFARLNFDLADGGFSVIEDLKSPLSFPRSDLLLILSWGYSLASIYAMGIHKNQPTAVKLYAHHPNERLLPKLYEPASVLITESLLANDRAAAYGIDPGKVLFLQHSYPIECETTVTSRAYVERLAEEQGKHLRASTKIIGCVSRLEYGKNCEFAVEAVRQLVQKGHDALLVLKGDFPKELLYPEYKTRFSEMLSCYRDEPWLLWDPNPTTFPQVLEEYANFDLLLHPSGAEGGSHVVIECLGLQKPVIVLNCSTNPYLFKGLATFVETLGPIQKASLPFYRPHMVDLVAKLEGEPLVPDKNCVESRFHESVIQKKLWHLFARDRAKLQEQQAHDRKLFLL